MDDSPIFREIITLYHGYSCTPISPYTIDGSRHHRKTGLTHRINLPCAYYAPHILSYTFHREIYPVGFRYTTTKTGHEIISINILLLITNFSQFGGGVKPTSSKRIDYIDLIKGIAIIGVVWSHTVHPQWYNVTYINALFFFLSGFFFKEEPFPAFLKKKVKTLIIPFTFFYLLSYPFRIIFNLWDYRTLNNFDWGCIFDVFDITNKSDYLFVNVPLWFIFCLFAMQLIYWCMNKITPEKYRTIIYLILTAVIMIWNEEIKSYPTIFMFNNAVQWLPYFIIGNLFGLKLSRLILDYPSKYIIVLTTLVTFIGLQAIDCNLPAYFFLKAIVLFLCFMSALSYFNDNKNHICAIVRTLGTSTLFILCIHILIQTPFQRAIMKIFGHREVFTGYIDVALTLLVIYLLIPFVNKYLPWAIGKKR